MEHRQLRIIFSLSDRSASLLAKFMEHDVITPEQIRELGFNQPARIICKMRQTLLRHGMVINNLYGLGYALPPEHKFLLGEKLGLFQEVRNTTAPPASRVLPVTVEI